METLRFPNGVICGWCNHGKCYKMDTKLRGEIYKCAKCRKHFSISFGTAFADRKIRIQLWFFLLYDKAINSKSFSSSQTARDLGVTQMTSYYMLRNIRDHLKQDKNLVLSGIVEVDESYVSLKAKRFHRKSNYIKHKRYSRSKPILGLVERKGNVILIALNDKKKKTVYPIIEKHVSKGSTIYTDSFVMYDGLSEKYNHHSVDHKSREYVRGEIYTNTIENVWSFFKKGLKNTHHHISARSSQSYCDEVAYRYNHRHLTVMERFDDMLKRMMESPRRKWPKYSNS